MARTALAHWLLTVEVGMPNKIQDKVWQSQRRTALALGVKHNLQVQNYINAWVWNVVVPTLQPLANLDDNGDEWRKMLKLRSVDSTKYHNPRLKNIVRELLEVSIPVYGPPLTYAAIDLAALQHTLPIKIWTKKFFIKEMFSELMHIAQHGVLPGSPPLPTPQEP